MSEQPPARRLVPLSAAADYCQVSPRTIRRLIAEGAFPAYRIGARSLRVDLVEVEDHLQPLREDAADASAEGQL